MPVDLDDDPLRPRVRLVVSAPAELFNSLHVLADPSHHLSNQEWAAATLAAMRPDLRAAVEAFGRDFDQWLAIGDALHLASDQAMAVPAFLDHLAVLPPARVAAAALGELPGALAGGTTRTTTKGTKITKVHEGEEALTPGPSPAGRGEKGSEPAGREGQKGARGGRDEARAEPVAFVARLLATLRRYWDEAFAAEWERRRPLLEQRRMREAARLDATPALTWLTGLHERIDHDTAAAALVFHKGREYRFALDALDRILVIPSSFTAPHLMVGFAGRDLTVFLNVSPAVSPAEPAPAVVLEVCRALGDETRLRIDRALLRRPHYTQELAAAMRLAEPTVSRHLKLLRAAGLARSRKEGGVVLYSGVLEPVDRLPAALREFVRG